MKRNLIFASLSYHIPFEYPIFFFETQIRSWILNSEWYNDIEIESDLHSW